ncbi:hypothetical protein [Methanosarcina horonobensis]|nr:hypothetical protein [Methanosarcina horonobensis]
MLYSAKEYDQALETYEKALEVGSELLKTDPENSDYQHYMYNPEQYRKPP